jgi:hypothetical protein
MPRRTIDPKVREEAVARKRRGEKTGRIAADIGVDPTTVREWFKAAAIADEDSEGALRRPSPSRSDYGEEDSEIPEGTANPWAVLGVLVVGVVLAIAVAVRANVPRLDFPGEAEPQGS